jgi:hypothetical protein
MHYICNLLCSRLNILLPIVQMFVPLPAMQPWLAGRPACSLVTILPDIHDLLAQNKWWIKAPANDRAYCHFTLPLLFDVIVGKLERELWHSSIRHLRSLSIGSSEWLALRPGRFIPQGVAVACWIGDWAGSTSCVDAFKYRKIFCSCRE